MSALRVTVLLSLLVAFTVAKTFEAHPCAFEESCPMHDLALVRRAHSHELHRVTIWTKQNNFAAKCPTLLLEVSHPASPSYGQHLSFDELKELVYDQEALSAIHTFLDKYDVAVREEAPNGEFVRVFARVEEIERMFQTELHHFESQTTGMRLRRAARFTLPGELHEHVDLVNGLLDFPMYDRRTLIHTYADGKRQSFAGVTPDVIAKAYNMPAGEKDPTPKADMAVFESLGQSFSPSDLTQFQQTFNLDQQNITLVIGPNDPDACSQDPNSCAEANLDVQYIMAMSQDAPLTYWSIPQEDGDIFVDFIEAVAADKDAPQVYSISYGGTEKYQQDSSMTKFNDELCKMGLRGFTLFVASGDDGAAGSQARNSDFYCGYNPDYPASCPYITTVGATMGPESGNPEVVCSSDNGSIITSGGGFSDFFDMPDYQTEAVQNWITNYGDKPSSGFNKSGRGYPDVAALGNAYNVVIGGNMYQLSGTSASTPVFCALVNTINGDREVNGKSPLGFLNPLLYTLDASVYNDITSGDNKCTAGQNGSEVCCDQGFYATQGWDPVTGFGSIDFKKFEAAVAAAP